jgi:hypothetical protein
MGNIYSPNLIIPNGALINDVCHIYESTKPTTRPDGSALVVGDKWYNTSTGVEGFWNGTYWLQTALQNVIAAVNPGNYGNFGVTLLQLPIISSTGIAGVFVGDFNISAFLGNVNTASNFHSVTISSHNGGSTTSLGNLNTIGLSAGGFRRSLTINTAFLSSINGAASGTGIVYLQTTQSVTGTPGNLSCPSAQISYNQILA